MTYWMTGETGDSYADATMHADRDCCPEPSRPIAAASVSTDAGFCDECTGRGSSSSESSESADDADTCEVEKSDGEICGRELPCRYHSE